jgi:hypothetical protein
MCARPFTEPANQAMEQGEKCRGGRTERSADRIGK